MNYKEKYEMALEGIQEILSSGEDSIKMSRLQLRLQGIFPELKESDDERTRKAIRYAIGQSTHSDGTLINGVSSEEALDWLEKQGEKPRYSIGDVLCDKSCTTLDKDAQPNFEVIGIKDGMYIIDKGSFPISQQDEYELVAKKIEQKPAEWSKEDDAKLKSILFHIEDVANKDVIDWLKSLKDRILPKIEWSEEDEKCSSYICAALECYYRLRKDRNNTNGQEDLDKARNWLYNKLKSLRPQNRWKPSDEQMEALDDFIYAKYPNIEKYGAVVKSLYQDLKKLTEE